MSGSDGQGGAEEEVKFAEQWWQRGSREWVQLVGLWVDEGIEGGGDGILRACKTGGETLLDEGLALASEWTSDREVVEELFQSSCTMMHKWFLNVEELEALKICRDDLVELPVWQLMGLVARDARLMKRFVLMLDHARVVRDRHAPRQRAAADAHASGRTTGRRVCGVTPVI